LWYSPTASRTRRVVAKIVAKAKEREEIKPRLVIIGKRKKGKSCDPSTSAGVTASTRTNHRKRTEGSISKRRKKKRVSHYVVERRMRKKRVRSAETAHETHGSTRAQSYREKETKAASSRGREKKGFRVLLTRLKNTMPERGRGGVGLIERLLPCSQGRWEGTKRKGGTA